MFSQDLISSTIKYYKDTYDHDISSEIAEVYLDALAGLFDASTLAFSGGFALTAAGGVIVGAGTVIGGGCTSGHGICGLSRLSLRSLVATLTFMAVAVATVFVMRHVIGS